MEESEGLLAVSFLVITIPYSEGNGGFFAYKLGVVRISSLETSLENHHPAMIDPVTATINILMSLGGEGAESFSVEVFYRGPT